MQSFIIRRGGYGPKTYWSGFKGDENVCARTKRSLRWSADVASAIRFTRESDANGVRHGLRMYRLDPSVIAIDDAT
ncbi:hypothetical protein [Bradyrhizobium lablabi]|uniref:hypothetical protein n=1 Tax=Bradyrhizobium lablabi TaxID=722472 RepID=UPI0009A8871C|nr:hypothetical protein [Bradyrhizobium lablabi]